jgi:hypothetical protein
VGIRGNEIADKLAAGVTHDRVEISFKQNLTAIKPNTVTNYGKNPGQHATNVIYITRSHQKSFRQLSTGLHEKIRF